MKILIATEKPFAPDAVSQIKTIVEDSGHTCLILEKYTEKSQLLEVVKEADAMIVRSDIVDRDVLEHAENLKIVVRAGAGYDNIDIAAATAHDICVMNTPGQNSNAVAEMVFGMMIYLCRSGFDGTSGCELKGRKLGLHAFGNIGKIVARIANGFGMKVFAYSPSLAKNPERGKEFNVTAVQNPDELYEKSDVVSLHMPVNDLTRGSVNYELLSKLPKNGMLINTARKEVVNEPDLIRIMEENPKFKYGSDIRLSNHDEFAGKFGNRYLASVKKCGAQTAEANINAGIAAAMQIIKFFDSGDETFKVNR